MMERRLQRPLCQGPKSDQESSRQDSRWGLTAHRTT